MALTEAQIRAKKKYEGKNRERTSYLRSRSSARSFINNKATAEDLKELKELIEARERTLKE